MTLWNKAQKAASWMDKRHPGWASKVNIHKLEMRKCEDCIIGQTFPGVITIEDFIRITRRMPSEIKEAFGRPATFEELKNLDKYWTTLIKQRLRKDA